MQRKSLKQAVPTALFGTHRMAGPVCADQRSVDAAFMPGGGVVEVQAAAALAAADRGPAGRPEVGRAVAPAREEVLPDDAPALPRDPVVVEGRAELQQRAGRHLGASAIWRTTSSGTSPDAVRVGTNGNQFGGTLPPSRYRSGPVDGGDGCAGSSRSAGRATPVRPFHHGLDRPCEVCRLVAQQVYVRDGTAR